jgi:hypothetical protein
LTSKQKIIERLKSQLEGAEEVRTKLSAGAKALERRDALRIWQSARLAKTHADLLQSLRYHDTAEFFLTDIYGPKDLNQHLKEVRQLIPLMTAVLPAAGLETVADAIELNALSERLDAGMVANLGDDVFSLNEPRYIAAYREMGNREDRERQIDLVSHLGHALDRLTRKPLIGTTLSIMRKPAAIAGISRLQDFLERGYAAFRKMNGAGEFLDTITSRERELMENWFATPE